MGIAGAANRSAEGHPSIRWRPPTSLNSLPRIKPAILLLLDSIATWRYPGNLPRLRILSNYLRPASADPGDHATRLAGARELESASQCYATPRTKIRDRSKASPSAK